MARDPSTPLHSARDDGRYGMRDVMHVSFFRMQCKSAGIDNGEGFGSFAATICTTIDTRGQMR
jgi:hypothetical protein